MPAEEKPPTVFGKPMERYRNGWLAPGRFHAHFRFWKKYDHIKWYALGTMGVVDGLGAVSIKRATKAIEQEIRDTVHLAGPLVGWAPKGTK